MSAAKAPGPLPPGLMASSLQRDAPEKSRDSAGFAGLSGSWTKPCVCTVPLKTTAFLSFSAFFTVSCCRSLCVYLSKWLQRRLAQDDIRPREGQLTGRKAIQTP